jgi:hypothetical protein
MHGVGFIFALGTIYLKPICGDILISTPKTAFCLELWNLSHCLSLPLLPLFDCWRHRREVRIRVVNYATLAAIYIVLGIEPMSSRCGVPFLIVTLSVNNPVRSVRKCRRPHFSEGIILLTSTKWLATRLANSKYGWQLVRITCKFSARTYTMCTFPRRSTNWHPRYIRKFVSMADGLTELRFGGTRVALCGMRTAHFYELSYVILEQKYAD